MHGFAAPNHDEASSLSMRLSSHSTASSRSSSTHFCHGWHGSCPLASHAHSHNQRRHVLGLLTGPRPLSGCWHRPSAASPRTYTSESESERWRQQKAEAHRRSHPPLRTGISESDFWRQQQADAHAEMSMSESQRWRQQQTDTGITGADRKRMGQVPLDLQIKMFLTEATSLSDARFCCDFHAIARGYSRLQRPSQRQQHAEQLPRVVQLASRQVRLRLRDLDSEMLARVMWAMAQLKKHGGDDQQLWTKMASHAMHAALHAPLYDLANMAWAANEAGYRRDKGLFQHISHLAMPLLGKASTQDLSMLMVAFAGVYGSDPDEAAEKLAEGVKHAILQQNRMQGAFVQAWGNVLHAFAVMCIPNTRPVCRFAAASCRLPGVLPRAHAHDIANILPPFVSLGHLEIGRQVAETIIPLVVEQGIMKGAVRQNWVNLLPALAAVNAPSAGKVFSFAADTVLPNFLHRADAEDLGLILEAYVTAGQRDSGRKVAAVMVSGLAERGKLWLADPRRWAVVLRAVVQLGLFNEALFRCGAAFWAQYCTFGMRDIRWPQHASAALQAFADVALVPAQLLHTLHQHTRKVVKMYRDHGRSQDIADTLHALAVMQALHAAKGDETARSLQVLMASLLELASAQHQQDAPYFNREELVQLWRVLQAAKASGMEEVVGACAQELAEAASAAGQRALDQAADDGDGSSGDGDADPAWEVAQVLQTILHQQQQPWGGMQCHGRSTGGAAVADVVLALPDGRCVAVQYDGPSHYIDEMDDAGNVKGSAAAQQQQPGPQSAPQPQRPQQQAEHRSQRQQQQRLRGGTILRNVLLLQQPGGFDALVCIPWFEWQSADKQQRVEYLTQRLCDAGIL